MDGRRFIKLLSFIIVDDIKGKGTKLQKIINVEVMYTWQSGLITLHFQKDDSVWLL